MTTGEQLLADTFLLLADTLVDDFDPPEVLTVLAERCVAALGATAVGIMIADAQGALQVIAGSSEQVHILELFQIQNHEGPCLDSFRTGRAVVHADLGTSPWPEFGPIAIDAGLRAVHAFPMRLRAQVVGTLNLFMSDTGVLSDIDADAAQALAHAATDRWRSYARANDAKLTDVATAFVTRSLPDTALLALVAGPIASEAPAAGP